MCVTGVLGGAGAGLAALDGPAAAWDRYAAPEPRLKRVEHSRPPGARAMIDVSDGLATDAGHLGRRSGVRLVLALAALPVSNAVERAAEALGTTAGELAATAGDDYELCACMPPSARDAAETASAKWASGAGLTWVGQVVEGEPGVTFSDSEGPLSGFEHSLSHEDS